MTPTKFTLFCAIILEDIFPLTWETNRTDLGSSGCLVTNGRLNNLAYSLNNGKESQFPKRQPLDIKTSHDALTIHHIVYKHDFEQSLQSHSSPHRKDWCKAKTLLPWTQAMSHAWTELQDIDLRLSLTIGGCAVHCKPVMPARVGLLEGAGGNKSGNNFGWRLQNEQTLPGPWLLKAYVHDRSWKILFNQASLGRIH